MKSGLLLVNTGSPAAPEPSALKEYLIQFLSDKRIVDYPRWFWQPILRSIIIPRRAARVAKLYTAIWRAGSAPLIHNCRSIAEKMRRELEIPIELSMRYGAPSIAEGVQNLRAAGCERAVILPLFPQFSHSTHLSIDDVTPKDLLATTRIDGYCEQHNYIESLAASLNDFDGHLIVSYHGLPARYIKKGDPYAEECRRTTDALIKKLGLHSDAYSHCYQSRFGPEKWLEPDIKTVLINLIAEGKTSVTVICPGFSCDCLETLEEVAATYRDFFISRGGKSFSYTPALNDNDTHIAALAAIVREQL